MSNLKNWVNGKFIAVMMVVILGFWVYGAVAHDWWPLNGSPAQQTSESQPSEVEVAWEGGDNLDTPAPAGLPAGTLTVDKTTVQHGQAVKISWDTANVTETKLTGTEDAEISVDPSGTMELKPEKTTTYSLKGKAVADGNAFERSLEVKVIPPLPDPVKELKEVVFSEDVMAWGVHYQLNRFWDSYCNSSVWRELEEHSYDDEHMQTLYDGVPRSQKLIELSDQLITAAKSIYRDLLSTARVKITDYVVTSKGNFTAEEYERCEQPYSEVYGSEYTNWYTPERYTG